MADRTNLHIALGAVAGAFAWTATEYASHRWVLHGPFGKGRLRHAPWGGLHRAHRRAPDATSLAVRVASHMAVEGSAALVCTELGGIAPASDPGVITDVRDQIFDTEAPARIAA